MSDTQKTRTLTDQIANRRRFLQAVGVTSAVTVAGCLGDDEDDDDTAAPADDDGDDTTEPADDDDDDDPGVWRPEDRIRYVVPYDEGGGTDVYARGIVEAFSDALGVPVQIDNVPGAGGLNGLGEVLRAEPDGQTIAGNAGPLEVAPQLLDDPGFDIRDLTGLGVVGRSTWCVVVNEEYEGEVETFDDVLEKYETGEWENIGVQSAGSSQDIIVLLYKYVFEEEVGWDWDNRVRYTGTGPVSEATASGEVPCGIGTDAGTQAVVDTGRIYPVCTFFSEGTEVYPDIPSVTDEGYPEIDFIGGVWRGIYGPPDLPDDIIEGYADALQETVDDERVQDWTADTGNPTLFEGPEVAEQNFEDAFAAFDEFDVLELVEEHS